MKFGTLSRLLQPRPPLGHLVWWTSTGPAPSGAALRPRWASAGLPPGPDSLPLALEQTVEASLGVPLLERSGVFWLAPPFEARLGALREVLSHFSGWELHVVPVRADEATLAALRASAQQHLSRRLATFVSDLEPQLSEPRTRASLLVRRLDALEALRQQGQLHAEHLGLEHPGLLSQLKVWASRIDAALCARIVA